ncbi:unnamed protein product [Pleuronectes platessa]|uniref:Uncharacterized protein n=1 Tax=Pleuronectes platessa TaxID=8262 RepID=A0A9N7VCK9_PLEPL|nr:unnamed protein product [Pleuronectes platessa]
MCIAGTWLLHQKGRRTGVSESRIGRTGSRWLHVSKPVGPPRANIKQPEHLFPDSAPRLAPAQMKAAEKEELWHRYLSTKHQYASRVREMEVLPKRGEGKERKIRVFMSSQ